MDKILLGAKWNPKTGRAGSANTYDLRSHVTLIAPTGIGKGVTIEIPNLLLGLRHMSVLSIDPSGQNAAVCAQARRRMGHETLMLNPFNLHTALYPDMADIGCNPLVTLDPDSPSFFENAMALGDASIVVAGDSQPHFPQSARGLMTWLMMYVRLRDGLNANLGTVRDLLGGDVQKYAAAAVALGEGPEKARGGERMASLAFKYAKAGDSREIQSVISTAETQTRWLLSEQMRASLSKNGVGDIGRLKDRPTSLFLILPADELDIHGVWLRMIVTSALNALYRRGGKRGTEVLMLLSEFAQLGELPTIKAAFGQARKYGIRLFPVLQDRGQLTAIYGVNGANSFMANSGCVIGMRPGATDNETAEWLSSVSGVKGVVSRSASDDKQGGKPHVTYSPQEERLWPPEKIRALPDFHGLVWKEPKDGKAEPQPVYLQPYYQNAACLRVARPDPYHMGAAWARPKIKRSAAVYLALGALVWAGVLYLGQQREGQQHEKPAPRAVLVSPPAPALHHAKHLHPAGAGAGRMNVTARHDSAVAE